MCTSCSVNPVKKQPHLEPVRDYLHKVVHSIKQGHCKWCLKKSHIHNNMYNDSSVLQEKFAPSGACPVAEQ